MWHKVHAFTHQLFLLFGDRLLGAVSTMQSLTTDYGVEANICKFRPLPLEAMCPCAASAAPEVDDDLVFDQEGGEGGLQHQPQPGQPSPVLRYDQ